VERFVVAAVNALILAVVIVDIQLVAAYAVQVAGILAQKTVAVKYHVVVRIIIVFLHQLG
jgi:hypothetical protein